MEYKVEAISKSGLNMGKGKEALAYGRLQWKKASTNKFVLNIEEQEVAKPKSSSEQLPIVDLDVIAIVNSNSRKYKEQIKELELENKRIQFKKEHPVLSVFSNLVKGGF